MGLFRSNKSLEDRARDERAKLDMKNMRVAQEHADTMLIREKRQKAAEIRRLTA
jgi:hypothetical protein